MTTLAAAYSETGNFAAAVEWQEKALGLVADKSPEHHEYRRLLDRYKAGKPYHRLGVLEEIGIQKRRVEEGWSRPWRQVTMRSTTNPMRSALRCRMFCRETRAMKIPVTCVRCGKRYEVDGAYAGRKGKCAACGERIISGTRPLLPLRRTGCLSARRGS